MRWRPIRLADATQIIMGQAPPSETYNTVGEGLPFFQGKAEFSDLHPITRQWCSIPLRVAEERDILLSVRAPVGPTNLAKERCCIGRGLAAIRGEPSILDQRFLMFFFKQVQPALSRLGTGSTFLAIGRKEIQNIRLSLPPLSEQRRIVEILDRADELRRLRAQANTRAERILPALFLKMFGDPDRLGMHSLGSLLRKSRGALQSGPFGSQLHNSDFVESGPVLVVGIDNVLDGEFSTGRNRRITQAKYEELRKFTLEPGDVLITIMGSVGRTCVFPGLDCTAICTKHVYRIQVDERLNPIFLSAVLQYSPVVRAQLGASSPGQIVAGINSRGLRSLEIPVPSREQQDRFSDVVTRQQILGNARRQADERLDSVFSNLLSRAFSGDLTASWREAHMKELLQEMEQQARDLARLREATP